MELYYIIAITDHDRGEAMGSLYHAARLHLILSMPARGTATSEHLAIYGLDATEKCVIAAVGSAQEADSLIRSAKRKLFIDIPGNGVMLTVPLKSVAGGFSRSLLPARAGSGPAPHGRAQITRSGGQTGKGGEPRLFHFWRPDTTKPVPHARERAVPLSAHPL